MTPSCKQAVLWGDNQHYKKLQGREKHYGRSSGCINKETEIEPPEYRRHAKDGSKNHHPGQPVANQVRRGRRCDKKSYDQYDPDHVNSRYHDQSYAGR